MVVLCFIDKLFYLPPPWLSGHLISVIEIRRRRRNHGIRISVHGRDCTASDSASVAGRVSRKSKNHSKIERFKTPQLGRTAIIEIKDLPWESKNLEKPENTVKIADNGISYLFPEAPFQFQHSYTEALNQKPLKIKEVYSPFGPNTMHRPWTGGSPIVSGQQAKAFGCRKSPLNPRAATKLKVTRSREEVMGAPLIEEEIRCLIAENNKSRRQLHIGRDGLTHNVLIGISDHWIRSSVCRIKCLGVCTVDMDNICRQLEDKTGGKIIRHEKGLLYIFRGRYYDHKTAPPLPVMLWRPKGPLYPRLVEEVPEGLTIEEVTELHTKGHRLPAILKLRKNGLFSNLVREIRGAFVECEVVRINCEGIEVIDFYKISAKLKDLVPCVLLSLEHSHILMWRGKNPAPFVQATQDPPTKYGSTRDPDRSPGRFVFVPLEEKRLPSSSCRVGLFSDPRGPRSGVVEEPAPVVKVGRRNDRNGPTVVCQKKPSHWDCLLTASELAPLLGCDIHGGLFFPSPG